MLSSQNPKLVRCFVARLGKIMECLSPNLSNVLTTRKCTNLMPDAEEEKEVQQRSLLGKASGGCVGAARDQY